MELRPEVRVFAQAMEQRLRENDHKPGWKDEFVLSYLFPRLIEEIGELSRQLTMHSTVDQRAILHECLDAANFLLMIADGCGALPEEEKNE